MFRQHGARGATKRKTAWAAYCHEIPFLASKILPHVPLVRKSIEKARSANMQTLAHANKPVQQQYVLNISELQSLVAGGSDC